MYERVREFTKTVRPYYGTILHRLEFAQSNMLYSLRKSALEHVDNLYFKKTALCIAAQEII